MTNRSPTWWWSRMGAATLIASTLLASVMTAVIRAAEPSATITFPPTRAEPAGAPVGGTGVLPDVPATIFAAGGAWT
jgi:hypothetical protein